MSVELWKSIFDWATVVLIALTVVSGAGALITGNIINRNQESRLHQFDKDLTNAKTELANAQTRLETERGTRLRLQRSVLRRMIRSTAVGSVSNFEILKPFNKTSVVFEYSPEGEPAMFSGNLATFAINSGWTMLDKWWTMYANRDLPDGVTVESYVGSNGETDSSSDAANAFATFLKNNGIEGVRRASAKPGSLPVHAVRVLVGQMPDLTEQANK